MIECQALSKSYGAVVALKPLTFSVASGEVVGLLGPNGAGKTTAMRLLTTYLPPTQGSAKVASFDIIKQPDDVRRSIGYLPESPPLYGELTVIEYLTFVGKLRGLNGAPLRLALERVLTDCFLRDVTQKLCAQLSKGYRQRVGLAQALIHNPPVIILDEPTSGLDPAQIIEIRRLIRDLRTKHTVILSTHILPEVEETCSRVIIIANGEKVAEGTLEELTKEKNLEERFLEAVART